MPRLHTFVADPGAHRDESHQRAGQLAPRCISTTRAAGVAEPPSTPVDPVPPYAPKSLVNGHQEAGCHGDGQDAQPGLSADGAVLKTVFIAGR